MRKPTDLSTKRKFIRNVNKYHTASAIIWSWFRYVIVSKYLCTMITEDAGKYEEWLTTIANTRLIYNTMDELETMMDNHSIHNNGMRRCFSSPQKLRAAFRDLKVEVGLMTDDTLHLDTLLKHYQRAWSFYHEHFYRRTNPERIAWELLSYLYPPYRREGLSKKKAETYQQIADEDIHVPFILLMLLKVVPGYDSKEGDIANMPELYERTMTLLETFTADYMPCLPNEGKSEYYADNTAVNEPQGTGTSLLPAIIKAREERNKTRLMLLYHVTQVLDTYEAFADTENLYDVSESVKARRVNLDITGYWNECGGQLLNTDFWQIEDALDYGSYFATHWHKKADGSCQGIRYALFLAEGDDGRLVYYMIHPEAIKHRMKGKPYVDGDHVWYVTDMMDDKPDQLPLHRMMTSKVWPRDIPLTRCTDESVLNQYDRWLNHDCEVVRPFGHLEYVFIPRLYAITEQNLYISTENEGEYYKVPTSAVEGFDRIQMGDNVGTMTMNHRVYLVFDELLLFIPVTHAELKKYGIAIVREIT